jgi:hypothetical protein
MKVNLTLRERIILLGVLQKEGDVLTQRIIRALRDRLGVSDEDWKTYSITTVPEIPGAVKWDVTKDTGVEYELGDKSVDVIKQSLLEMDKQKKVNDEMLSLFDKFIPEGKAVS